MVLLAILLAASALSVNAQSTTSPPSSAPTIGNSPLPLTDYTFTYPNLPQQVNPFPTGRGPQFGYNVCNSSTEGPTSLCQTMFLNDITDFCLWSSPTPNGVIGDVEAKVVAYCTKAGHGTRLIPPGTLTAVQFIKTPGYIQVTGLLNQTNVDLQSNDGGGELDPHGADLFGNPLGGLVFSDNLPTSAKNGTFTQVDNWSLFIGSNEFCFKACDNSIRSPDYCNNIFDVVGCGDNMPAAYAPGQFLSCLGDNQEPPNGGSIPIPATSSCTTYTSSLLYPNTASTTTSGSASASGTKPPTASATGGASKPSGSSAATVVVGRPGTGFVAIASTIVVAALAGVVFVL